MDFFSELKSGLDSEVLQPFHTKLVLKDNLFWVDMNPKTPKQYQQWYNTIQSLMGSPVVRSSLGRAARIRVLAGDIVLCLGQNTLTVPLSTQVYKWVLPMKLNAGV